MSQRFLHRTAIEGGRVRGNKQDRRQSNRTQRAKTRAYVHQLFREPDADDFPKLPPQRRKVGKSFADKLNPIRRWLTSKAGLPWDEVNSILRRSFDFRSLAGMHVLG